MLEQLFGSHTRMKLLQLFLSNPEEKYFVRELTRMLDSQINAIRRELENLSDLGIIFLVESNESEANRKFYQSNTKFVLFPELKSIFQKSQFLLEKKFAKALKKIGKIYYLALMGTFVGDKNIPTDLLIVGNINKKKFAKVLKSFEKELRREINYTLLDKEEFDYRRSVADRFLYSLLDAEKIVMVDEIFNKYEPEEDEKKEA